jgi:hypothetical protein
MIRLLCGRRWEPLYQWGDYDLAYTSMTFMFMMFAAGASHVILIKHSVMLVKQEGYALSFTQDVVGFGTFSLLVASWLMFTVWDLQRVNVIDLSFRKAGLYILLGMAIIGPGASLVGAWWLRERLWEKSRQRRSDQSTVEYKVKR